MKLKINKRYNCVLQELDAEQIEELKEEVRRNPKLDPWFAIFVERFYSLAHDKELSKKDISKMCKNNSHKVPLLGTLRELPTSTLSDITNWSSKSFRMPSVNNLISLSSCFDVTIEYLIGKQNCKKPEYEEIHKVSGLSNEAIQALNLKKDLYDNPIYTSVYDILPIDDYGQLAIEKFPKDKDEWDRNKIYALKKNGELLKEKTQEEVIKEINSKINAFSELFEKDAIISELEGQEIISNKIEAFSKNNPDTHYFDVLNKLITYKNGLLINLLSQYLYNKSDSYVVDDNPICADGLKEKRGYDVPPESMFLFAIQTELIKLHGECQ